MPPAKNTHKKEVVSVDISPQSTKNSVGIKFYQYRSIPTDFNTIHLPASLGLKLFTYEESVTFKINQAIEVLQNKRPGIIVYATMSHKNGKMGNGYLFEIDTVGLDDFKLVLHSVLSDTHIYSLEDILAGEATKPFSFQKVIEEIVKKTVRYKK